MSGTFNGSMETASILTLYQGVCYSTPYIGMICRGVSRGVLRVLEHPHPEVVHANDD